MAAAAMLAAAVGSDFLQNRNVAWANFPGKSGETLGSSPTLGTSVVDVAYANACVCACLPNHALLVRWPYLSCATISSQYQVLRGERRRFRCYVEAAVADCTLSVF